MNRDAIIAVIRAEDPDAVRPAALYVVAHRSIGNSRIVHREIAEARVSASARQRVVGIAERERRALESQNLDDDGTALRDEESECEEDTGDDDRDLA